MDNREAIDQLKSLQQHCLNNKLHKHHEPWESDIEALDLAINVLDDLPVKVLFARFIYVLQVKGILSDDDKNFILYKGEL